MDQTGKRAINAAARQNTRLTLDRLEHMRSELNAHLGLAPGLVRLARALGLPDRASTALWIVGRSAGWVAHVMEQRTQAFIMRPRAKYGSGGPVISESFETFETPVSR